MLYLLNAVWNVVKERMLYNYLEKLIGDFGQI